MAKLIDGFVLSDKLFIEYNKYKRDERHEKDLVARVLHFPLPHGPVTNIDQYERTGVDLSIDKRKQLANNGLRRQSLEELAKHNTPFKVILCDDNSVFPFVNVADSEEKFETVFAISYKNAESRDKCVALLRALCEKANKVVIYDKYFSEPEKVQKNIDLIDRILPHRRIKISCYQLDVDGRSRLQSKCADWEVEGCSVFSYHDRYLLIDDSIEVVLSSGFDHLGTQNGDLICVVRKVKGQRRV